MSRWTHEICLSCWKARNPGLEASSIFNVEGPIELCCYCGTPTSLWVPVESRSINEVIADLQRQQEPARYERLRRMIGEVQPPTTLGETRNIGVIPPGTVIDAPTVQRVPQSLGEYGTVDYRRNPRGRAKAKKKAALPPVLPIPTGRKFNLDDD